MTVVNDDLTVEAPAGSCAMCGKSAAHAELRGPTPANPLRNVETYFWCMRHVPEAHFEDHDTEQCDSLLVRGPGATSPVSSTTSKPTNPKDSLGANRTPFHLIPMLVLGQVALGFLEGAIKYGPFNWRTSGVRSSIYLSGALRHLIAYMEGEEYDPVVFRLTGVKVSHLAKVMANLLIIMDAKEANVLVDDRAQALPSADWSELNAKAEQMLAHAENLRTGKRGDSDASAR